MHHLDKPAKVAALILVKATCIKFVRSFIKFEIF